MASKPLTIASRSFGSQKEATDFFRGMLRSYTPGDRVNDTDTLHLAALLERHTQYVQKVGCGLDYFSVVMTEHGTPLFHSRPPCRHRHRIFVPPLHYPTTSIA